MQVILVLSKYFTPGINNFYIQHRDLIRTAGYSYGKSFPIIPNPGVKSEE